MRFSLSTLLPKQSGASETEFRSESLSLRASRLNAQNCKLKMQPIKKRIAVSHSEVQNCAPLSTSIYLFLSLLLAKDLPVKEALWRQFSFFFVAENSLKVAQICSYSKF